LDEKEKASWPLMLAWRRRLDLGHWDDALEKEEAFLTLGCFGSMRCRNKCYELLSSSFAMGIAAF